ncbi:hypothetical protein C0991_003317 [Blastosporella zonata]|nr:hypothetical protein C0991_003317 [Blastosporella zonata]
MDSQRHPTFEAPSYFVFEDGCATFLEADNSPTHHAPSPTSGFASSTPSSSYPSLSYESTYFSDTYFELKSPSASRASLLAACVLSDDDTAVIPLTTSLVDPVLPQCKADQRLQPSPLTLSGEDVTEFLWSSIESNNGTNSTSQNNDHRHQPYSYRARASGSHHVKHPSTPPHSDEGHELEDYHPNVRKRSAKPKTRHPELSRLNRSAKRRITKTQISAKRVKAFLERIKEDSRQCPECSIEVKRPGDLKRHIISHGPKAYPCIGVLLEEAPAYKVPATMTQFMWEGRMRIGGCQIDTSRRDALKRHCDFSGCVYSRP